MSICAFQIGLSPCRITQNYQFQNYSYSYDMKVLHLKVKRLKVDFVHACIIHLHIQQFNHDALEILLKQESLTFLD